MVGFVGIHSGNDRGNLDLSESARKARFFENHPSKHFRVHFNRGFRVGRSKRGIFLTSEGLAASRFI